MTPFDKDAACGGAPILLRDGTPAAFLMDNSAQRFVLVDVAGLHVPYPYTGKLQAEDGPSDLVMA